MSNNNDAININRGSNFNQDINTPVLNRNEKEKPNENGTKVQTILLPMFLILAGFVILFLLMKLNKNLENQKEQLKFIENKQNFNDDQLEQNINDLPKIQMLVKMVTNNKDSINKHETKINDIQNNIKDTIHSKNNQFFDSIGYLTEKNQKHDQILNGMLLEMEAFKLKINQLTSNNTMTYPQQQPQQSTQFPSINYIYRDDHNRSNNNNNNRENSTTDENNIINVNLNNSNSFGASSGLNSDARNSTNIHAFSHHLKSTIVPNNNNNSSSNNTSGASIHHYPIVAKDCPLQINQLAFKADIAESNEKLLQDIQMQTQTHVSEEI
jgi:hypothetical protein